MDEKTLIEKVDDLVEACQEETARALIMQHARFLLEEQQTQLQARIEQRPHDLEACADSLDRAAQASRAYLSAAEAANTESVLVQVQAALLRLEQETFGVCVCCKKPIPVARLARVLTATMCIPCHRERNGGDRRRS